MYNIYIYICVYMVIFITLTNSGYIDYTLNCLKSLEKIKFTQELNCYCIGQSGTEILTKKGYKCTLIDEEENSNFQLFRNENWSHIVFNKFEIIHQNLLKHDYVCYTDGDIVYENKDFINYLLENIRDKDILIQNDCMYDDNLDNLCSGFMFIKSNNKTIELFNPHHVEKNKNKVGWGDQIYINEIKDKLRFGTLPLHLFPNGNYYYNSSSIINPYLIHFNWLIGHEKREKMKYYNKWFV